MHDRIKHDRQAERIHVQLAGINDGNDVVGLGHRPNASAAVVVGVVLIVVGARKP